ncbi:hypothetical protein PF002_g9725 [Phytophthora fragariae]|uniref:Uncharacterized protein n=2 Tax=Phytophthora TaxID=4783 RepID=A0A6A3ZPK0_9STRA|nr:hypothetical protein PF003_g4869 [Phytophthora fragariae]KAE9014403.1 hypothetical protein PR002_g14232 [Phytophthora rubi]KAE9147387.1 hypothetical protein PF006_g7926 [Phytophthora fragariae]KAE9240509.1 hypothetical protein PF002_g9725 [Phytophthora fragariae]
MATTTKKVTKSRRVKGRSKDATAASPGHDTSGSEETKD